MEGGVISQSWDIVSWTEICTFKNSLPPTLKVGSLFSAFWISSYWLTYSASDHPWAAGAMSSELPWQACNVPDVGTKRRVYHHIWLHAPVLSKSVWCLLLLEISKITYNNNSDIVHAHCTACPKDLLSKKINVSLPELHSCKHVNEERVVHNGSLGWSPNGYRYFWLLLFKDSLLKWV